MRSAGPPLLVVALLSSSACSRRPPIEPPSCGRDIPGLDSVKGTSLLMLGEMHGMQATPVFVGDVACRLAAAGKPVLLALEIPVGEQPRIDAFMDSAGSEADRAALLAGPFWSGTWRDGRSSVARLELLERVRALRKRGLALRVLAFDTEGQQQARETSMARAILAARRSGETTVVLVGNLHARTRPGVEWNPGLVLMGVYLREAEPGLVTLDTRYGPGELWACMPDCGLKTTKGNGPVGAWSIERSAAPDDKGFDGVYHTGAAEASYPATPLAATSKNP